MKLRFLFLIFLFAAVAASWVTRTQIAGLLIPHVMHRFGLADVDTNISQLDLNQSQLLHFTFTLADDNSLFRAEAHDIKITYNPSQLAEGRIDSLNIDRLSIHYENKHHPANSETEHKGPTVVLEPITILAALRHALREYTIFNTVSIQQITLSGETFAALQDRPLRLNIINDHAVINAELTLLDQASNATQDTLQQLVISRLDQNTLKAELRLTENTDPVAASLELFFQETDTEDTNTSAKTTGNQFLTGNYRIMPARLLTWLRPFTVIQDNVETGELGGTFSISQLAGERITTSLTAKSDHLKYDTYKADKVFLNLKTTFATTEPLSRIKINNGSYLKAANYYFDNASLTAAPLYFTGELTASNTAWKYQGGAKAETLDVTYPPYTIQLKSIAASLSAEEKSVNIDGNFSPAKVPGVFSFNLVHDLNTGHGGLNINPLQAIDLNAENHRLSQLITPWDYPFELLTGKLRLSSKTNWSADKALRVTAKVNMEDGGGTLAEEIIFSGLKFEHELELLPQLHSLHASNIDLKHLDSGVSASNISTRLTMKSTETGPLPRLVVRDLHGEIFDGRFSGEDFVYDLNKNRSRFKIKVSDIDLARIVETQQMEDIEVTGRVDGTIPVEINGQGLFIEHGALVNAVRDGTIRYNPAAATGQLRENPLTGIALDALKDFRYSHLAADVNYTPEGILTVNLQLQGTSPELDTDRPVHLNINTEQNLLTLLKSLRFAQGVSDNIDKKVRQQYEKSRAKN